MKKRLVHESRIMFIKIMSIFLLVSILVSVLYVYVTYNGEKEILLDDCEDHFSSFMNESLVYTSNNSGNLFSLDMDGMEYTINNFQNKSNRNANFQAVVFDKSNEMLYVSQNCYVGNYSWYLYGYGEKILSESISPGYVTFFYDDFIDKLDNEQIENIKNFLTCQNNSDGSYYELICKEFYYENEPEITEEKYGDDFIVNVQYSMNTRIIPSKLEIVLTNDDHDWYVQDEVIAEFEVDLDQEFINTHHFIGKQTETKRNVIDKNFVLGKYEQEDLYSELSQKFGDAWIDNKGELANTVGHTNGYYQISPFEYIYCGYDNSLGAYNKNDDKELTSKDLQIVKIRYLEKINVLESCINRIGMTFYIYLHYFADCRSSCMVYFMEYAKKTTGT